jgi:hypothetical protein
VIILKETPVVQNFSGAWVEPKKLLGGIFFFLSIRYFNLPLILSAAS